MIDTVLPGATIASVSPRASIRLVGASTIAHGLPCQRIAAVLPMVRDTLRGRWAGAPKGRVLGGLAGLAYVISPLDFIPEVLLGPFGLGDDLAIAAVSVAALLSSAEDWLDARDAAAAMGPTPNAGASTRATQGDVIQGVVVERS